MNRRAFLGAALASAALGLASCNRAQEEQPGGSMRPGSFELEELTITDLASGLQQNRWSSRQLVQLYLDRINAVDRKGPALKSIIELNPDALDDADRFDQQRKQGRATGALHGIPILVKDNIEATGKMSTTAGSLALEGWISPNDSFVVAQLRAAGAIILGKTNLSEWANFRSSSSSSGWSGRGGQTRNPYAADRNPSGSSSGSGVAASASFCAAAIGTETDGSVVSPSSVCGIVGIKPTVGLVSRTGIIPISHTQDTAGPMARTVRDAAILLGAMTGIDEADLVTKASESKAQRDYTKFLNPSGLRGARIGIPRKVVDRHTALSKILNACVDVLKKSGAEVIDPAEFPAGRASRDDEFEVLLYEFKADLNTFLAKLPPDREVHSLADLIKFNEKNRGREMPWFEQETFIQAEAKGPLTESKYLKARGASLRSSREEGIDALLKAHKLDAIVSITSGPAPLTDLISGGGGTGGGDYGPAAAAGYPHITVPAGFVHGLPVGLSFVGTAWSEPLLLRLAYAFEQETNARTRPQFLPTLTML
jgi:amidase